MSIRQFRISALADLPVAPFEQAALLTKLQPLVEAFARDLAAMVPGATVDTAVVRPKPAKTVLVQPAVPDPSLGSAYVEVATRAAGPQIDLNDVAPVVPDQSPVDPGTIVLARAADVAAPVWPQP